MSRTIETAALVLRGVDYGEADKVCTLLTEERGKVSAFARGARGSKKRFRGGLGSFVELRVTLRERGDDSLAVLVESEAIASHTMVGADLVKMAAGTLALDLLEETLQPDQGAELYPTAARFVRWLAAESGGPTRIEAGAQRFQLLLLSELGLLPNLATCARSGHPLEDGAGAAWLPEIGLVERAARHPGERAADLPGSALGYIRGVAAGAFPISDVAAERAAVRGALRRVWQHHLGKDPRSWSFYAGILET